MKIKFEHAVGGLPTYGFEFVRDLTYGWEFSIWLGRHSFLWWKGTR